MTQPRPAESAIATLASRQAAAQAAVTEQALTLLEVLWGALRDPAATDQLPIFSAQAAALLRSAQLASGQVTESYLRQVLEQLGVDDLPGGQLVQLPDSLRQGVPIDEVLLRPAATVRYLRSLGTPPDAAEAAGRARLRGIAETDLELAVRQGAVDIFSRSKQIRGYRRVLRPYLSKGGSCGLCIAAADRIYGRSSLMPIHNKCKCSVLPIVGSQDPGVQLNTDDLAELYSDAGGTSAAKLKRTRYRIEQHGELGPLLVRQGRAFRSADDVADDLKSRRVRRTAERADEQATSLRRQLATYEATIPDLERRARAGEDVSAPLTWQRARVAELQRQLAA